MDLVVRSPHGDADVSVDTDLTTTTLGDTVAAVTGQAVPAIVVVDGRVLPASTPLADEHVRVGSVLSEAEREEDIDTLGGLVFSLAGRIPKRGEVVKHPSGLAFEIVDADSRRIKRLKVKNLPKPEAAE